MDTLTIKIRDQKAIKLIQDLELLNLIQIVPAATKRDKKLSEIMAGSMSKEQAMAYHKDVQDLKGEWERNTY